MVGVFQRRAVLRLPPDTEVITGPEEGEVRHSALGRVLIDGLNPTH